LGLLAAIARLAPLMGLLGTVSGMITIFSRMAHASGGVDLSMLADGIWQALLNTASGLSIAIFVQFSLAFFHGRLKSVAAMLDAAGNAALLRDAAGVEPVTAASHRHEPPAAASEGSGDRAASVPAGEKC
jgi:biopolymer transport protein ExbB